MSQPWPSPALVSNEQQSGKEKYFTVSGRDWGFPFMEIVMKVILVSMCEKSLCVLLSFSYSYSIYRHTFSAICSVTLFSRVPVKLNNSRYLDTLNFR